MKNKSKQILAIAIKNNWQTPISEMTTKYKNELFELLLISSKKDMRERIFEARDTKQTHYLLQLDTNNNVIKILSNPNDYERI